jgi:hypothetical protein
MHVDSGGQRCEAPSSRHKPGDLLQAEPACDREHRSGEHQRGEHDEHRRQQDLLGVGRQCRKGERDHGRDDGGDGQDHEKLERRVPEQNGTVCGRALADSGGDGDDAGLHGGDDAVDDDLRGQER